jgi:hypothetical protein
MASDSTAVRSLKECYATLAGMNLPRTEGRLALGAADVDLFEEDSYLAGLVSTFLATDSVPVDAIVLKSSIDEALAAAEVLPGAEEVIERFKDYREKMRELALLLSRASGIPLR